MVGPWLVFAPHRGTHTSVVCLRKKSIPVNRRNPEHEKLLSEIFQAGELADRNTSKLGFKVISPSFVLSTEPLLKPPCLFALSALDAGH